MELSLSDLTTYMQDFRDRGSNPEIMHVKWRSTNWATVAVKNFCKDLQIIIKDFIVSLKNMLAT